MSWDEARSRLRELLERYLEEPSLSSRKLNIQRGSAATEKSSLSWWIRDDLDIYAGSLPLSIALFILAWVSLHGRRRGEGNSALNPAADISIYRGELAASVLLVAGSVWSLWMVRRRRFLCNNDGETAKRREISRFLRTVESDKDDKGSAANTAASARRLGDSIGMSVSGTALTDIYPVYRQSGSEDHAPTSWTPIPSLLLVAGDYIALQVGDIAPATCSIVYPGSSSAKVSSITSGDRIKLTSFGDTPASVMNQLPRGRTTLPMDSDHLLTLSNKMRIFRVQKAPLDDFIHRSQGK